MSPAPGRSSRLGGAICHITHVDNLADIVRNGCLWCDRKRQERGIAGVNIAHSHLKSRRSGWTVAHPQGGTLADYVPFYFCPRSPMLYALSAGQVAGYEAGQDPIIHLVADAFEVAGQGHTYLFTDGHAAMGLTQFFNDLDRLGELDWPVIRAKVWNSTTTDPDRSRRKQAEFLVWDQFPWTLVREIGVRTESVRQQVMGLVAPAVHRPAVHVRRAWYY